MGCKLANKQKVGKKEKAVTPTRALVLLLGHPPLGMCASGAKQKIAREWASIWLVVVFSLIWQTLDEGIWVLLKEEDLAALRHINKSISLQSAVYQSKSRGCCYCCLLFPFEQIQKQKKKQIEREKKKSKNNNNKKKTSPQVPALVKTVSKLLGGH